ncbi:cytidylyltransferase domain-containing protein [Cellulosimicrobium sp. E-16]|uniref:cytidylyltransferase domain-containing protein n=1 Tax=Cellulosimicrobium sp. E-16 TaxID=3404049 RepID=UPI003CF103D4
MDIRNSSRQSEDSRRTGFAAAERMEHYGTVHETPLKVVAVIQARTGSSRLPGKVLRPLAGRPVLAWMIRAASAARGVDEVVVATSTAPGDDAVAELAASSGVRVVRGSEDDVLSRFVLALEETAADAIVRLTADCPLVDPVLVSQVVALWRADPTLEYVATTLQRTLPRGLDVELASRGALLAADAEARDHHRVHVTSYLYAAADRDFRRLGIVVAPTANELRVTLDTPEDAEAIEAIVDRLGDTPPRWHEVVDLLRGDPALVEKNAAVRQKALADG